MPVDHDELPFDDRLGAALRQAGDSFETDGNALVAAGRVRGRRLRMRRRATVAGGVAGIALVGVGGALLVPWSGDDGGQRSVAASRTPLPDGTAVTPDRGAVSGPELLRTLEGLLPEGTFSAKEARSTDHALGPYAGLVFDDGNGKAAVQVGLGRIEPGSRQAEEATTCPDKALVGYDACNRSELPDGSVLMIFQGYEYPDRRVDTKHWYAQLVTPQGQQISVMEWNAAAQKGAPVTRPDPPLSPAQLKSVVTAREWRAAVDTIPEPESAKGAKGTAPETAPAAGGSAEADGRSVRSTLVSLLPEGVEVTSKGGQETEYAYVVVDDGKGRSFVQINVQADMSDVEGELFGPDAERLPDGTKVATHQGPGDKGDTGVVMWTVDTIRTDGMRVVVSAFNAGAQNAAATRDTPALTMEQLRSIATSAKWREIL
ncbi:hypothetical protein [Streptomyces sp. NBC_00878]|uniref:hypothetical protein n=1 Tax=Streptomyces sp. NBC_00878 TaxID=2975854 RepID=UPI00225AF345|nr:hypothetical protein [Streptomyces sp. NBC_00878]MCX4905788.1 hypothetical protein [Streptomyces sp. NBC_00878]